MSKRINLSVIIPVYNTSKYLRRCLDSVFSTPSNQTEVIVINDGSTDNSKDIIESYQARHDNLRYFEQDNQGLPSVKNRGLKEARGEYIVFLDSDDYVEKGSYDAMLKTALKHNADLVECAVTAVYPDGGTIIRDIGSTAENNSLVERSLNCGFMSSSCNKLVKRELYENVVFPALHNEDVAVTPILLLAAKTLIHIDKPFYYYVQHEDSINHGFSPARFDIFETVGICLEKAKQFPKKEQYMLEGYLFAHQLVALLFCAIAEIADTVARKKAITTFCRKYHSLGLKKNNLYAKKYLSRKNILDLYDFIESLDISSINDLITTVKI